MMKIMLLAVFSIFLHAVSAAPQFITFKDGKIGVNFGGYSADAGLGSILTGNPAHGGLSASAGTPWGPRAAAGIGGSLDGSTSGLLYANADANPSVGASAVLGGETGGRGSHGVAASEAHANGVATASRFGDAGAYEDARPVTYEPRPQNSIQKIKPPKKYSLVKSERLSITHSSRNNNNTTNETTKTTNSAYHINDPPIVAHHDIDAQTSQTNRTKASTGVGIMSRKTATEKRHIVFGKHRVTRARPRTRTRAIASDSPAPAATGVSAISTRAASADSADTIELNAEASNDTAGTVVVLSNRELLRQRVKAHQEQQRRLVRERLRAERLQRERIAQEEAALKSLNSSPTLFVTQLPKISPNSITKTRAISAADADQEELPAQEQQEAESKPEPEVKMEMKPTLEPKLEITTEAKPKMEMKDDPKPEQPKEQPKPSKQPKQPKKQQQTTQVPYKPEVNVVHSKKYINTRYSSVAQSAAESNDQAGANVEIHHHTGLVGNILNIPIGILRSLQESLSGIHVDKHISVSRSNY